MKWVRRGLLFNPSEHNLFNGCNEFAQSPQTLVFDDYIRIYFSTRKRDQKTGMYRSYISFVDFDKDLEHLLAISKDTVIELGGPGSFDEHGIFPINILRHNNQILAYTCGWSRRVSVSVETSTGLAISDDNGLTFKKYGSGPILSSSINEPFLVGDSFVQKYESTFHMWYIFGTHWTKEPSEELPARVYKIGHAVSIDGINWERDSKKIISDKLNKNECQALPTVVKHRNKYHMFFCYRHSTGFRKDKNRGYRIGYASSEDLINWKRDDDVGGMSVSKDGWDSDMQCYPHVFRCDDKVYLLYNGNEFGRHGFGIAELLD